MKKELELYLHIPFCIKKCAYCDFLSGPASEEKRQSYVNALIREIESQRECYKNTWHVTSIFLGGGTPSILHDFQIAEIFSALHKSFYIAGDAEITMEVNPGTVTGQKLKAWKQAGINRLSIGLQSVNDEELEMLGRIHSYKQFLKTYELVRSFGFHNVNIDLISAIPGQTTKSWKETISRVAELNPEHISAYSLIIEEGTPFYERYSEKQGENRENNPLPELPCEEEERQIYEITKQVLSQYGYTRYEISNYAKEGFGCRHNIGYWERKEYLGFGIGAASLIGHTRFCNTASLEEYIEKTEAGSDVRADVEQLSEEEELEEFMFLGLRMMQGVSKDIFQNRFGRTIEKVYGTVLQDLESKGLIEISEDRIKLTGKGIDVSNLVFVEFMSPEI